MIEPETLAGEATTADLERFPLSFSQERLWLLHQFDPHCLAYNTPLGIRLHGPLNIPALEAAVNQLLRRHEILRMALVEEDDLPLQIMLPEITVRLEPVDIHSGGQEIEAVLQKLTTEESRRPFSLLESPLWRVQLLRLSETDHVFVMTIHHLIVDGWSREILREELETLYEDCSQGRMLRLPELPLHYADYADWQRNLPRDSAQESALNYWRDQLADAPVVLDLPTDFPRPTRQSYQGLSRSIELPQSLVQALQELAQQGAATLFMALFGAFSILIGKYARQDDVVIGTPVAGRNRRELEQSIGLFVNLLAIRIDLTGDPTFRDLLQRVRTTLLEALAHQETPFEQVVQVSARDRRLSTTPIIQILFQFKNYPQHRPVCTTVRWEEYLVETQTAAFDLAIELRPQSDRIVCRCEFASDLFAAETIEQFLSHYRTLLQTIADNSDRPISSYQWLTEVERLNGVQQGRGPHLTHELALTFSPHVESSTECVSPKSQGNFSAPSTPLEMILAQIWSDVLGIEPIGRDENFFELGGHSLAAIRIVARCRRELGTGLLVASLFQHPTIRKLAESLAHVGIPTSSPPANPRQQTIATSTASRSVRESINPQTTIDVPPGATYPLSPAQQRLYFLDQLGESRAAYNITQLYRLNGPLDLPALVRSFTAIIQRHEPLRTVFHSQDGVPFQTVRPARPVELPLAEVSGLPADFQSEEIRRWSLAESETVFDLSSDQLLRARVIRLGPEHHVLILVIHHIAADGFSLQVFWDDLRQIYAAEHRGGPPELEPMPCCFAAAIAWQASERQTSSFTSELQYWRDKLKDLPALELPTDRRRLPQSQHCGARLHFTIDATVMQPLRAFSRDAGVTPHMTLLAAFAALLHRVSGQADFAVGVPILGRGKPEFESLIGMFVNTLPLRVAVNERLTFRELLAQVRQTSLEAYDRQSVPFEQLVEVLDPDRHAGRNPLVQVLFQLLETSSSTAMGPVQVTSLPAQTERSHVDLEFLLRPQQDELAGDVVYNTELFDRETIARWIGHYQQLLRAAVQHPDTRIARLPLLSPAERDQLLVEFNRTEVAIPQLSIPQLFAQQAERRPTHIAVADGEQSWTYETLHRHSNRLAQSLRKAGVRPHSRVGICVERSYNMLVGLLAILKAGAAYVPLDPHYPPDRRAFLLADSSVSLVVTQPSFAKLWREHVARLLVMDAPPASGTSEPDQEPDGVVAPDSPAYVIYTSGSTGEPKGVEVLHHGVVRLVRQQNYVQLDETQTVLHLATLSFDASTFEIWGALLNGGTCVLAPPLLTDTAELQRLIRRHRIRTVWLTSTLFNAVIDEDAEALLGVEQLLIGGEALSVSHVRRAQHVLGPTTQIINGYGPTECTTFACCYSIPREFPAHWTSIPIGRPIANTTAYVLDKAGSPVPIGVAGELHLGGLGLARGYLNQPELTAARLVANPFSDDSQARLYRTGDRVRWKPGGTLEFLGRLDDQVKVRGYRVEPGEIESMFRQHSAVSDAVVISIDDPSVGSRQLAAYLLTTTSGNRTSGDWRAWLSSRLPEYMIPAHFIELDQFPRTPGGKVDRRRLPAPLTRRVGHLYSPADSPRTKLEGQIAAIWSAVLNGAEVPRHADFFNLGGHSLLALRVAARMSSALGRSIPVALFFSHPTVAAMAQAIERLPTAMSHDFVVELKAGDRTRPLFLFPPLGAELFSSRALIESLTSPVAVLALDWHHGEEQASPRSLVEISRECARHIQSAQPVGPYLLAGYSFGGRLAFETACRLLESGEQIALLAAIDSGPGGRPTLSWQEHLAGGFRLIGNIPRWLLHDFLSDSLADIAGRLNRKFHQLSRQFTVGNPAESTPQIEDLFEPGQFPPWFQARQQADLNASAAYQPRPASLKVTLFRAEVRPLLQGHWTDFAWRRVALEGVVTQIVPGNHGTMMRVPHVHDLAQKLAAAIDDANRSSMASSE